MRLKKGSFYWVRFYDHNEETGRIQRDPKYILNIVGMYMRSDKKRVYLRFANFWGDDGRDEDVKTTANIIRKAVISIRELK